MQKHTILSFVLAALLALPAGLRTQEPEEPYLVVLGIAQDGGYPQAGCNQACCRPAWEHPEQRRHVASLAIVDPQSQQRWLIDATPDFKDQLHMLDKIAPRTSSPVVDGIFLSHGHIGHYTGLMHLGREAMGAKRVPVFAMPRMQRFLQNNGPWDQLLRLHNIELRAVQDSLIVQLNARLRVMPLLVPHRDEYTETVGFRIIGPNKTVVYISDIDKWQRWSVPIEQVIRGADVAFLDGTFFSEGELPGRDMSEIPHPFIVESMRRFAKLPASEKRKVHFLHFNHTNPAMQSGSKASRQIEAAGFRCAREGQRVDL